MTLRFPASDHWVNHGGRRDRRGRGEFGVGHPVLEDEAMGPHGHGWNGSWTQSLWSSQPMSYRAGPVAGKVLGEEVVTQS